MLFILILTFIIVLMVQTWTHATYATITLKKKPKDGIGRKFQLSPVHDRWP